MRISNLPPQTLATEYYNHIIENLPSKDSDFKPLMTLYLTDNTTPEEIKRLWRRDSSMQQSIINTP